MDDLAGELDHDCEETLSILRHELGGPLAVVDMVLDSLVEHLDELPDHLRDIVAAGRRQLDVAQATLDDLHVAGQEGELKLDLEPVDLVDLTERYVDDLRTTMLEGRDVRVETPSGPVSCRVDTRRYGQVLRNLLENADKYTPAGTPVRVRIQARDHHLEVWVVDSGEGVAPEDTERIFERYVRGQRGPTGAGIGLAISREIARAHGGDLSVTDAPDGPGARFVLELPLA